MLQLLTHRVNPSTATASMRWPGRIDAALDAGGLPDIAELRSEFLPTTRARDDVTIPPPNATGYNCLLVSLEVQ